MEIMNNHNDTYIHLNLKRFERNEWQLGSRIEPDFVNGSLSSACKPV